MEILVGLAPTSGKSRDDSALAHEARTGIVQAWCLRGSTNRAASAIASVAVLWLATGAWAFYWELDVKEPVAYAEEIFGGANRGTPGGTAATAETDIPAIEKPWDQRLGAEYQRNFDPGDHLAMVDTTRRTREERIAAASTYRINAGMMVRSCADTRDGMGASSQIVFAAGEMEDAGRPYELIHIGLSRSARAHGQTGRPVRGVHPKTARGGVTMPVGPNGEKRPADVIANAVLVGRIATGEAHETHVDQKRSAAGKIGGRARAAKLSAERKREISMNGVKARREVRHGG